MKEGPTRQTRWHWSGLLRRKAICIALDSTTKATEIIQAQQECGPDAEERGRKAAQVILAAV